MFDFFSFHHRTEAVFHPVPLPHQEPDFISPSKSVYWNTQTGVIRASDHWVGFDGCTEQATCRWVLHDDTGGPGWRTGYCPYTSFQPRTRTPALLTPTERDAAIAHWLTPLQGACTLAHWTQAGFGAPPRWLHRVHRGSIAATQAATRLFAQHPELTHALCARQPALDAARMGAPVPWY